jgi:hypothetical protein
LNKGTIPAVGGQNFYHRLQGQGSTARSLWRYTAMDLSMQKIDKMTVDDDNMGFESMKPSILMNS